jgi:tetratricopeptide (TPR) repeat protein
MVVVLVLCGASRAESPTQAAKRLYQSASKHYALQDFVTALDEFQQAYGIKEDPAFLFNIAQCQRLLGQREPALRSYKIFLSREPNAPNRADVQGHIDALQGELDAQAHADAEAKARAEAEAKARDDAARVAAMTAAQNTLVAAPPPKKTPVYKKWWLWTTVGVVVVGVGLGVGLGLGLNRPHTDAVGSPASF